jgi:hypothetical protein
MERKVKKNNEAGYDNKEIVKFLRKELIKVHEDTLHLEKTILLYEKRAVELSDQLDYMREKYGADN